MPFTKVGKKMYSVPTLGGNMNNQLTAEYVNELFRYDNGKLYWKIDKKKMKPNDEAGRTKSNGYCEVRIDGKLYGTHRIIFLMTYGYLPKIIDHIDGNPRNNNIENLREATHAQNMKNSKIPKHNTSGIKGVYWDARYKKWIASCYVDNVHKHVGTFDDIVEAAIALDKFRKEFHKEFANNG